MSGAAQTIHKPGHPHAWGANKVDHRQFIVQIGTPPRLGIELTLTNADRFSKRDIPMPGE